MARRKVQLAAKNAILGYIKRELSEKVVVINCVLFGKSKSRFLPIFKKTRGIKVTETKGPRYQRRN